MKCTFTRGSVHGDEVCVPGYEAAVLHQNRPCPCPQSGTAVFLEGAKLRKCKYPVRVNVMMHRWLDMSQEGAGLY